MIAPRAEDTLARDGWRVVRNDVPNGDYPPGYVVAQSPCAGCQAVAASTVTISVSKGAADLVVVPNVLGLTADEARATLARGRSARRRARAPGAARRRCEQPAGSGLEAEPARRRRRRPGRVGDGLRQPARDRRRDRPTAPATYHRHGCSSPRPAARPMRVVTTGSAGGGVPSSPISTPRSPVTRSAPSKARPMPKAAHSLAGPLQRSRVAPGRGAVPAHLAATRSAG